MRKDDLHRSKAVAPKSKNKKSDPRGTLKPEEVRKALRVLLEQTVVVLRDQTRSRFMTREEAFMAKTVKAVLKRHAKNEEHYLLGHIARGIHVCTPELLELAKKRAEDAEGLPIVRAECESLVSMAVQPIRAVRDPAEWARRLVYVTVFEPGLPRLFAGELDEPVVRRIKTKVFNGFVSFFRKKGQRATIKNILEGLEKKDVPVAAVKRQEDVEALETLLVGVSLRDALTELLAAWSVPPKVSKDAADVVGLYLRSFLPAVPLKLVSSASP